ncbi:DUF4292 domain-containing protein [Perlabentimonas gracilis]|uniref:DUF4292 domain-containing protein n=1 Tax=Perlabentimonas gracilis TaxID=2715279 RepID=UPI001408E48E|nr:DUF4292 domain-containing protein [Perlabentimonas gracilis]NHB68559.1 DUF4292 domain-containing protein [Perlabentimonas gracilis]
MYRNLLILLLLLSLVCYNCTRSVTTSHIENYSYDSKTRIVSTQFERSILRIDTDGHLRTHRANLAAHRDKFIHITILSNLRKPLANVLFDSEGLKVIDIQQNSGFDMSYSYLHSSIGIPLTLNGIQRILFGACDVSASDTASFLHALFNVSNLSDVSIDDIKSKFEFNSNGRLSFVDITNTSTNQRLTSRYVYNKASEFPFPQVTNILVDFNNQPMEFELEYDIKHLQINIPAIFQYDSLIPLKILTTENE